MTPGYKEIMAILTIIGLFAVVLLMVNFQGVDELVDPDISIEVTGSWYSYGPVENQLPVEGKKWQVVDINVTNLNEDGPFQISIPHFYGTTDSGKRVWVFNSEDYQHEPIGPGEGLQARLIFDINENDVLARVEYTQRVSSPIEFDVPAPLQFEVPKP